MMKLVGTRRRVKGPTGRLRRLMYKDCSATLSTSALYYVNTSCSYAILCLVMIHISIDTSLLYIYTNLV
jgi:hypothetical protein